MENKNGFTNDEFDENEAGMVIRADSIEIEVEDIEEAIAPIMPENEEVALKKKDPMREILEWIVCIVVALILTWGIKSWLFEFVVVDGESMLETLQHGERLVMTKLGYTPKQGDIIVLDANYKNREAYFENRRATEEDFGGFDEFSAVYLQRERAKQLGINKVYYVKRVIALEGDVVDIDPIAGTVTVNGEVLDEPYLEENEITPLGYGVQYPYTVEPGHVFVMGDNRARSMDSRYEEVGTIPVEAVSGKVAFRVLPFSKFGGVYDYDN